LKSGITIRAVICDDAAWSILRGASEVSGHCRAAYGRLRW
jgi:hypothetical protein